MMKYHNDSSNKEWKNLKCPKCGKTNIGWQTHCLLCGADLLYSEVQKEAVYKCPSCNDVIQKGQKFCTSCGNKIPENLEALNEKPKVNICSNCGAELKLGAKFCTECGTKV